MYIILCYHNVFTYFKPWTICRSNHCMVPVCWCHWSVVVLHCLTIYYCFSFMTMKSYTVCDNTMHVLINGYTEIAITIMGMLIDIYSIGYSILVAMTFSFWMIYTASWCLKCKMHMHVNLLDTYIIYFNGFSLCVLHSSLNVACTQEQQKLS